MRPAPVHMTHQLTALNLDWSVEIPPSIILSCNRVQTVPCDAVIFDWLQLSKQLKVKRHTCIVTLTGEQTNCPFSLCRTVHYLYHFTEPLHKLNPHISQFLFPPSSSSSSSSF